MASRDLEVDLRGPGAADLDRVDDEVGAFEGGAALEVGLDRRRGAERAEAAGIEPERIVNTWPKERLLEWANR